ncbi:MAG: hypothetical protein ABW046_02645 [Actinoplanes sp.]
MQITFVGWSDDDSAVRYLYGLQSLVQTMRQEARSKPALTVRTDLVADAAAMSAVLCTPADVIIYGGHGGIHDDEPFIGTGNSSLYLSEIRAHTNKGITAAALVLDCCYGGEDRFQKRLMKCLDRETVIFSSTAKAPYTHGPVLLPILLAQLACPDPPPQLSEGKIRAIMQKTLDSTAGVWSADWKRWVITSGRP